MSQNTKENLFFRHLPPQSRMSQRSSMCKYRTTNYPVTKTVQHTYFHFDMTIGMHMYMHIFYIYIYIYIHTHFFFKKKIYIFIYGLHTPFFVPTIWCQGSPRKTSPVTSPVVTKHLGDHRASGAIHHIQHQAHVAIKHREVHLGDKKL